MPSRRRRKAEADAPPAVLAQPAIAPDHELGHFRHPPYSIWSGVKYVFLLSLLLWWLPTIGQMIAGYIGGRRAGGPWRGVVAAVLPVLVIVLLAWALDRGLLAPYLGSAASLPQAVANGIAGVLPPLAPYAHFVVAYLGAFVAALQSTLSMGANGYLVTIVFAYIGGILADQARREAALGHGTSVGISITQPLVSAFHRPAPAEWGEGHAERFEEMRRIPVRAAAAEAPEAPRPKPKPHKVETRPADSGAEEGGRPARGALAGPEHPERQERTAHDNEVATRRFVERALRQYEAAHRREGEG